MLDNQREDHQIKVLADTMKREIAAIHQMRPAMIAIDGPAGAGKSTIGYKLATLLDFFYFDTGIMYRAATYAGLQRQSDLTDSKRMGELVQSLEINVLPSVAKPGAPPQTAVQVDGEDITVHLRTRQVDRNVSVVSAHAPVRQALSTQQRRIGERYGSGQADKRGIVMVGRDIGTVVLPMAPLKIYMVASLAERARRRFVEEQQRGKTVTLEQVVSAIERRDQTDSERALSPLRRAHDAIELDTSEMDTTAVVRALLTIAHEQQSQ